MIQRYPHTITLIPPAGAAAEFDESGAAIPAADQPGIDVPAFVDPVSGGEFYLAQQVAPRANQMVFMDFRDDITTDWTLIYEGDTMQIHDIRDQGGEGEILVLYVSRG